MYSFFIHIGSNKINETSCIAKNIFDENQVNWIETGHTQIGISSANSSFIHYKNTDYFLVGKIDNIKKMAASFAATSERNEIELCVKLLEEKGWEIVNDWKGCFALIANNIKNQELLFTIGNTGLMQSYIIHKDNSVILTSELKAFCNTTFFERKMIPIDSYQYEYTKDVEPDFCFLQNINRVLPGYYYALNYKNSNTISINKTKLFPIHESTNPISKTEAKEKIYSLLSENIKDKISYDKIGIPISGGLDSGLIASLVHQQTDTIYTYTIGTNFGNEFENAKDVHQFLNSVHEEINIDEDEFWEGFLQSVWHNEICDPLYAEGYVGFYHSLKQAQKDVHELFTGYGADLILGDFLNIKDRSAINSFSEYWGRRAAWTGEMSPYTARSFGMEIQHPFWEIELINFSLSIPYEYKYLGDEVKALLREMAEEKKLLPSQIAWRKKNAFTTGASLDQLFSHCLKIPYLKNYRFKSIFLYYLFEELFVLDKHFSTIDIQELIKKTSNYVR